MNYIRFIKYVKINLVIPLRQFYLRNLNQMQSNRDLVNFNIN